MEPFNPNPYPLLQGTLGIVGEVQRFSRYDPKITPTGCLGYMKQLLTAAESVPDESIPQNIRYETFPKGISNLEKFVEGAQGNRDSDEPVGVAQRFAQIRIPVSSHQQIVGGQLLQEISDIIGEVYARDEDWNFHPWYHDEPRFHMHIGEGGRHLVAVDLDGQTFQGDYPIRISASIFNKSGDDSTHGHWETKYEDQIFATISRNDKLKIDKRKFRELYTNAVNALNS